MSIDLDLARKIKLAVEKDDLESFIELLSDDKSLMNFITPFGSWLHIAASSGAVSVVDYLIANGFDLNVKGGTLGGSALNTACSKGKKEIVEKLLKAGADMDVSDPTRNPLFASIYGNHIEIAKLLLDRGIDTKIKYTGENMTDMGAIEFALERGSQEIADMITTYEGCG
ncbi:ankyrin repeat domain-containing protein [Paraneptunicella aestuarii]|uniref:ankyrin repeat domain-containing protein n=1 Tax=Paraneptunicella aestuarii TaxID=2831148 RepID=UPI001E58A6B5|nr:ankyrin repeat domain-containing protein [Paraneptunicella aestuarii]UAA37574.1 ankyrin repeat domain-containing protein [Paraneptunicella aestuarii]